MELLASAEKGLCPPGMSPEVLQGKKVLAAVSGGVDSMVMLDLLVKLSADKGFYLYVITVNHNIRPDAETAGDAEFVRNRCMEYGIPCTVYTLEKGLVSKESEKRGKGTEEAARYLRYKAFDEEAARIGAFLICIAHNRNDRLETILQRFLQGSSVLSSFGMRRSRGIYIRPLFDVSRSEIEEYALQKGLGFRTDSTNADNSYFRNRIRNRLIPLLNELEPGWDSAVIHGAEKNMNSADDIYEEASEKKWSEENEFSLCMAEEDFDSCSFTARFALLYEGLSLLKCQKRIPYSMLSTFVSGERKVSGAGISLERRHGIIYISVPAFRLPQSGEEGFYIFVEKPGRYLIGDETVTIRRAEGRGDSLFIAENEDSCVSGLFHLPLVIRSGNSSDSFRTASGERKLLSKIFSEWRVAPEKRTSIPVFEDGENRGVWGSLFGYPDWFVKPDF